jgi:hypothetical protein
MTIGFFHVENGTKASEENYSCARALVRSVRETMPGTRVVQFTDEATQAVKGVDAVRRKPSEPMALLRMRHHAGVKGEWVFVDTDVIFQHKVNQIFKLTFDIGLTSRAWEHLKPAMGFSERMPFNTGVVFSRKPHFWQEVYCRLKALEPEQQQWMGDQEVIGEMAMEDSPRYDFRVLNGRMLNFPPVLEDPTTAYEQSLKDAWIVHYKGPKRKRLLMKRIKQEEVCV